MKTFTLLYLFTSLVSSLTIPPNQPLSLATYAQLTHKTPNSTVLTADILCTASSSSRLNPHIQNCAAALRAFPAEPDINMFHFGGAGDVYQLPWFERSRDCEILVELDGATTERSSWTEVGLAAMELMTACTNDGGTAAGGITLAGWDDNLKITVRGYSRGLEGNSSSEGGLETA